jgi:glycosyltransferase involved in cell wall biosynthesis
MNLKISLILATIHRTDELDRFLNSLKEQTYRNFKVIIVDQNKDNRLDNILRKYEDKFELIHLKSTPGLSKARNVGLNYATGDIIGFPDDDCWYDIDLLDFVARWFTDNPQIYGLTGQAVDTNNINVGSRFDQHSGVVSKYGVWTRGISITIFLRKTVIESIGKYDEELGVGSRSKWGSGEETDYLLRAINSGFVIYYLSEFTVFHPQILTSYNDAAYKRAFFYGAGMGRVLRKHKYPLWFVIYNFCRPFGGTLLSLLTNKKQKAIYHWNVFKGRLYGYF